MGRWNNRGGRVREEKSEERRSEKIREDQRRERVRREKMQLPKKVGKSQTLCFSNDLGLRRVEK
jgi:hypothetical protein